MRVQRLILAALSICTIAACSDSTGTVTNADTANPQLDSGYLGNGGRSDSTSNPAATSGGGSK
jgi:hypothetical protein